MNSFDQNLLPTSSTSRKRWIPPVRLLSDEDPPNFTSMKTSFLMLVSISSLLVLAVAGDEKSEPKVDEELASTENVQRWISANDFGRYMYL